MYHAFSIFVSCLQNAVHIQDLGALAAVTVGCELCEEARLKRVGEGCTTTYHAFGSFVIFIYTQYTKCSSYTRSQCTGELAAAIVWCAVDLLAVSAAFLPFPEEKECCRE